MITTEIDTKEIQQHYDRLSRLYRLFWGNHLHHGYWEKRQSRSAAQTRLIEKLAVFAAIENRSQVLDVGCGLGGSTLWLARNLECQVVGLTISSVQVAIARRAARRAGLGARVTIEEGDANRLTLGRAFDAVWVIECSEHLHDKAAFFKTARAALRSGGRLALCAWLAGDDPMPREHVQLVREVCDGMLCPSLATRSEYESWMREAGFTNIRFENATRSVERTWDLCLRIAQSVPFQAILKVSDTPTRRFVGAFEQIRRAYAEDAMQYGMFAATAT